MAKDLVEYSGHDSLALSHDKGKNLSNWMYEQFKDKIKGDILEIGSGLGIYSEKIVQNRINNKIVLSDISQEYVNSLKRDFNLPNVETVLLDLNNEDHVKKVGKEKFDTVIGLNVVEHIRDDEKALKFLYDSLRKDGQALILVPAHPFLYNSLDKKLEHYRRYSKKSLHDLIAKTEFKIDEMYYFNALGILGWYMTGNILKNDEIDEEAYSLYDKIIPLLRIIEKYLLFRRVGISLIVIMSK